MYTPVFLLYQKLEAPPNFADPLEVIVAEKSSGCLQIGSGPWSSIIFVIFDLTPLTQVNQI